VSSQTVTSANARVSETNKTASHVKLCLINIVYMGDSITFGQYIDPTRRWTAIVEDRLTRIYLDTPIHINGANRGISGETTRQGLERFPNDVQNLHPDIMTLQFGLNDCNCWLSDRGLPRVSEAAFRANLIEMITRARHFGAKQIILSNNHPTPRFKMMLSGESFEEANARYSEIIREVASETGATFCNIRAAFSGYSVRELEQLLLAYPDLLHLNEEGNRVYAEAIWPHLERAVAAIVEEAVAQACVRYKED
jgi:acyl-CoA thioesterase-1